MADIGSLIIRIKADASEMEKTFQQLGGSAKQFERGLDNISKTLQTAFFAATTAAIAMTIAAGKTAEETEQLAQKTGIAAGSLEGMTVLMNRNGLSSQSMALAMKGLSKEMVGVQSGTASSIKLFEEMGVSLAIVEKGTGATLRAIADRFKEMPDGANKAKIAVDLFGKAGLDWIPILNKGSASMDEAMKKSAEFGLILSDTARNQLTVFDDAMDDLMSALKGFGMQVGIAFAPSMTILVQTFTDVIVFTKNVFNQLSDAASTLGIRLGAIFATVQLFARQLLSTNQSMKGWQETFDQHTAIDQWAASQIQGVASAREAEKELSELALKHLETSKAVEAHANSQKVLGEQIVANTRIQLQQATLMGQHQERMGGNIVSGAVITNSLAAQEGKRQEQLGKRIQEEFAVSQQIAQDWIDAYNVIEDASTVRFQAEMDARDKNEEAQGRFIVQQSVDAQKVKGFWTTQLDALVASNAFSVATITTTWTSGLANAIVNGGNFMQAAWKQTQVAIIQGGLNLAVQFAAQEALKVTAAAGAAAGYTAIWAGATAAVSGFFAATSAAFKLMMVNMVAILTSIGKAIMGVLTAIADALSGTIFGSPFAVAILAGVVLIGAALGALAATGNLGFKEGGIGEFGSGTPAMLHGPEAIIPLNSRGADFLREAFGNGAGNDRPIIVKSYLDGRQVSLAMSDRQPSSLRTMGIL